MKKNENGLGVIGALVVMTIIGLVSAVGWFVYQRQSNNVKDNGSRIIQATAGHKIFEDKEHGFYFEYPENLQIESDRIWSDKNQGGLEIWVYDANTADVNSLDEPAVLESEGVIAKITVVNTDIDDAIRLTDFLKPIDKKELSVCGETAITISTKSDNSLRYVTDFKVNNLLFGIDTHKANGERKAAHDKIVKSIVCS